MFFGLAIKIDEGGLDGLVGRFIAHRIYNSLL